MAKNNRRGPVEARASRIALVILTSYLSGLARSQSFSLPSAPSNPVSPQECDQLQQEYTAVIRQITAQGNDYYNQAQNLWMQSGYKVTPAVRQLYDRQNEMLREQTEATQRQTEAVNQCGQQVNAYQARERQREQVEEAARQAQERRETGMREQQAAADQARKRQREQAAEAVREAKAKRDEAQKEQALDYQQIGQSIAAYKNFTDILNTQNPFTQGLAAGGLIGEKKLVKAALDNEVPGPDGQSTGYSTAERAVNQAGQYAFDPTVAAISAEFRSGVEEAQNKILGNAQHATQAISDFSPDGPNPFQSANPFTDPQKVTGAQPGGSTATAAPTNESSSDANPFLSGRLSASAGSTSGAAAPVSDPAPGTTLYRAYAASVLTTVPLSTPNLIVGDYLNPVGTQVCSPDGVGTVIAVCENGRRQARSK